MPDLAGVAAGLSAARTPARPAPPDPARLLLLPRSSLIFFQVLKYHIIPKPYTTAALVDGRKYPTLLTVDALASRTFLHRYQIDATKLTVHKASCTLAAPAGPGAGAGAPRR